MKKTLSIMLAMLMMVSIFTACGNSTTETPTPNDENTPSETASANDIDTSEYADLPSVNWTYTSAVGESTIYNQAVQMLADRLAEETGGKFTVETYYAGALMNSVAEKDAVSRGTVQMCCQAASILADYADYLYPFSVAYNFKSYEHYRAVCDSELWAGIVEQVADDLDIRMMKSDYTGFRNLNLRGTKDIQTPEDMAGIKLRVSNNEATLFMAEYVLGANPIGMDFNEVYSALQTGAIDGHENPLTTIYSNKFYEVTDSIVMTEHSCELHALMVNETAWQGLAPEYQELFTEIWNELVVWCDEQQLAQEAELLSVFEDEGLVIIYPDKQSFIDKAIAAYETNEKIQKYWDVYQEVLNMDV